MNKPVHPIKSTILRLGGVFLFALTAAAFPGNGGGRLSEKAPHAAKPATEKWPHPFPCRIHEGANRDLFIMTLGDVKTSLADGVFDPAKDQVTLNDGTVIMNYYRDSLGIKFFKPIDKSEFPLPPSGWCSWYYYYQEINAKEIERNAEWIAHNLKGYGADYVQIDDGWQGKGHGSGDNRDWTTVNGRFAPGMDKLAAYIKSLGLKPGLWLAPHGQSNPKVVADNPGAFLMNSNTSVSRTWEGEYLVDPSSKAGLGYLRNLFTTLKGWGYDYFKIDGQPIVIDEYALRKAYMEHPSDNTDSLYRATIETVRNAVGEKRYLLGCWGIPLDGVGIMNGSRTGGDVELGWSGFMTSLEATMHQYFLHNVAWYCDPDVMLLRYPLTLDQARAWATLQGLTGEALMSSDRLPDLPADRVEILKSVFPAQDIRPLDLYPSKTMKHIWDLKISHLGRDYDVVGLFNFDMDKSKTLFLKLKDLCYDDTSLVQVFDFWNKEYLGAWRKGMAVTIPPTSVRVLTLLKSNGHIQLISTNRHITQGYPDLISLESSGNEFHGKSKVIAGAPYSLYFAFPRGENFKVGAATVGELRVKADNHQGWARVEFTSPKSTEVNWEVSFTPADYYHYPVSTPYGLSVVAKGLDGAEVHWSDQYNLNMGCEVYLNGDLAGYTPTNIFPLTGLNPDSSYEVSVKSVWEDGRESNDAVSQLFKLKSLLPDNIYSSELHPVYATIGWGTLGVDRSVMGSKMSIDGGIYEHGLGTHANSDILFNVDDLYARFTAVVGLDDNSKSRVVDNGSKDGSVVFFVYGDGHELWHSGVMTHASGATPVSIDIKGVKHLLLKVTDAGDGIAYDHADWANARLENLSR
ncbi:MAG TPA: NPCBM/NEW2 domain-containing protein [Candidatus Kryptobacter bacterium]|nr:NPCBM/NEW2 domain-containing protein [Candidatus Kryptobacter bacterium]